MSHIPDPNKNVNLTVDGRPVTVPEGTTILEAARRAGINIPVLCHHPDLKVRAVCRLCAVECDGGNKLKAACSNAVAEGLKVVTDNERLRSVRRTILELIFAEHPQDCPICVRNQSCELQKLAQQFGLYKPLFRPEPRRMPKTIDSETLVRDMGKCVKCGRCVEMCQEVQGIRAINTSHRSLEYEIATPYEKPLAEVQCVYCGQCVAVCPVGALYEYDQTETVFAALADKGKPVAAMVAPAALPAIGQELGLPAGAVTAAKMATALKMLGVAQVFDGAAVAAIAQSEEAAEAQKRIKEGGVLPIISGRSPAVVKFVETFYPDLAPHMATGRSPQQVLGDVAKVCGTGAFAVSIEPSLSGKFRCGQRGVAAVLTPREVARMVKRAGLAFANLPETAYDALPAQPVAGGKVKTLAVEGFKNARQVLDDVRAGRFKGADLIDIAC